MKCVVFFLCFAVIPLAWAKPSCPYDGKEKASANKSGLHCVEGALGMWFPLEKGRELLKEVAKGEACKKTAGTQRRLIDLEKEGAKILRKILDLERQRTSLWKNTAGDTAKVLSKMSPPVFYEDPWFWTSVASFAVALVSVSR
jgi:hypothetical protein